MKEPSRRLRPSSDVKCSCSNVRPKDACPRPAVCARSTKNGPKYGVERSTVPSSGLRRYRNALEDVGTGSVARFASSAREIVSVVACVDARSRSGLPVCTD
jgi:hypothetical protein